jgi:hypothetical protein
MFEVTLEVDTLAYFALEIQDWNKLQSLCGQSKGQIKPTSTLGKHILCDTPFLNFTEGLDHLGTQRNRNMFCAIPLS